MRDTKRNPGYGLAIAIIITVMFSTGVVVGVML